ncbi:unnamed protein product [Spirodela intermedia]|uniref:CMP/dCMP-type deaminase domain-containing protein n=1 Tax=Spirodela intermedia TaxID=51605 RepID=A0A7I8IPT0_SPIIN|nr:unnamed protein product [Spirodela intermedia]CAA6659810.1 unnamed protein product [Spirodela intermedia]
MGLLFSPRCHSGGGLRPVSCLRRSAADPSTIAASQTLDAVHIRRAAEIAELSAGLTSPHPNFGCVIANGRDVAGEGFLYAQGTKCAELQAVEAAGERCRGATAYLNLEPGDCYADHTPVSALLKEALKSCLVVNAPLLYRAAYRLPFSILKYAMTLDGKIAASSGHASWVSSKKSRNRVFELRARSDAVIVGGNTVRRDDGHVPVRIVMSQTLDLPEDANLWNISDAYTIVATQRGARKKFQQVLASKGVEVVEFDILNPRELMEYCYDRGYLSVLWECGGNLAAPAISSGIIHKVWFTVSYPGLCICCSKNNRGVNAPSPVGELGMVEMSQAFNLLDVSYEQIGTDMLISGFLLPIPDLSPVVPSADKVLALDPATWDSYGAFSNFSPHPPEEAARIGRSVQRKYPNLVHPKWDSLKIDVMYRALKRKFSMYTHLNSLLLSTAGSVLVEASPHDLFWGGGRDGEGLNYLGRLLMQLRSEILEERANLQLCKEVNVPDSRGEVCPSVRT